MMNPQTGRRVTVTEEDLAAVVEHSPIAMGIATAADGILLLNRALTELTGYDADELMGRRLIHAVVHPEDVEAVRWVGGAVMGGQAVEVRHRTLTKSGEVRYVRGSIAPMNDGEGAVRWAVAQYVDETELIAGAEALERSRDAFRAFAQAVAHDLRTPLTAIGGFAELLSDSAGDRLTPEERNVLETIERSSVRAADQVAHALAKASTAQEVQITTFSLSAVVERVRELLSPQLLATGADLVLADDDSLVTDEQVLFEVILNLAQNSLKYRSERIPVIAVSASRDLRQVRVSDNGRGIPSERWGEIFEPTVKVDEADDGLGLGLARSRRLIESVGGRLYVESSSAGDTTMVISLPSAWR